MDCQKTRERLSEYIDGMLGGAEASALKRHLEKCAECAEEYRSATAIIEHMQRMERVEEPADFIDKVNSRLDKRFSPGGIVKRLFVPWRIKIPLEAVAAAAVILVIVYLGGVKEPEPQYQITITESDDRLLVDEEIDAQPPILIQSGALKTGESEKAEGVMEETVELKKVAADADAAGAADMAESTPKGEKSEEPAADTPKSAGTGTHESAPAEAKSAEPVGNEQKTRGGDAQTPEPAERAAEQTASDAPKPAFASGRAAKRERASFEKMSEPERDASLEETIRALGGKVIEAEYLEGTRKAKRMIVEIPVGSFERLIQELIRRGEIKAPPTEIKRKTDDLIRVELIFERRIPPQ